MGWLRTCRDLSTPGWSPCPILPIRVSSFVVAAACKCEALLDQIAKDVGISESCLAN
jgi:hypothetical protein